MPIENRDLTPDAAAMAKLDSFEAELAAEDKAAEAGTRETPNADDRPLASPDSSKGAPDSKPTSETPSDADKQAIETARAEADKEGKELDLDDKGTPKRGADGKFIKRDKVVAEKPLELTAEEKTKFAKWQEQQAKGKYAKDAVRKDTSWRALNEEKEKFNAEKTKHQQTLNAAIAKFNADVAKHQAEVSANRLTPERFDAFAQKLTTDAAVKEAEMLRAESAGDLDKAKELYAEVKGLKDKAAEAKAHAEHLRKNPPPNEKQIQEKLKADQSTWVAKANTDYPEFAKKDSAVRNVAIETYKEITAADPQLARLPGLIYHCVKYAATKTAADRVPEMDKELGELRTKVKELELLTNPTPPAGVARPQTGSKPYDQMTEDEQFAALRAEAAGMKR